MKRKLLATFVVTLTFVVLTACNSEQSLETKIIGKWKTSSFTLADKQYDSNSNAAFLDGVMIAHMQMFFKEGESVIINEDGSASFHGVVLNYTIENDNRIIFSGKQFGEMNLMFTIEQDNNNLLFKHELGTAVLIAAE